MFTSFKGRYIMVSWESNLYKYYDMVYRKNTNKKGFTNTIRTKKYCRLDVPISCTALFWNAHTHKYIHY